MPQVDLFLSLAEIAGVFVGFGALIAVRSGGTMQVSEINDIRWVVTFSIWVVITALAPIIVGSYGLTGHELWLVCSLLALAIFVVMVVVFTRTPENQTELRASLASANRTALALVMAPTFWLPATSLVVALVLVVLGVLPDQERALYLTAVALGLLTTALGLFVGVFWLRRPSVSADPAGRPASGGANG